MNLQEDALRRAAQSEELLWTMMFFFFTRLLFPVVKHSIQKRWIFVALGLFIAALANAWLYEIFPNAPIVLAILAYAIFIPLGIYITIRMRRRDRAKAFRYGSPLNPHAPTELSHES